MYFKVGLCYFKEELVYFITPLHYFACKTQNQPIKHDFAYQILLLLRVQVRFVTDSSVLSLKCKTSTCHSVSLRVIFRLLLKVAPW